MNLGAFSGNVKHLVESLQKYANQLDVNLEKETNVTDTTANA